MELLQNRPRLRKFIVYAAIFLGAGALIRAIIAGYSVTWTGFADYQPPHSDYVRGKTLWDWMELLFIPLVLAGGAFYLNKSEQAVERKAAEDRANLERELAIDRHQEAALQAYLDRMAELLLEKELRTSENEEVRNVARTRTLTVLRGLDATRKGLVLRFLYEAKLITEEAVVVMDGAELSEADLVGAKLIGAKLIGARLSGADLRVAKLRGADLSGADLRGANLSIADLDEANLMGAHLWAANLWAANIGGADLSAADLSGAILRGATLRGTILARANLSGARVFDDQLATAKSLAGAIMPDGTIHD